jgi:hypothetical protein
MVFQTTQQHDNMDAGPVSATAHVLDGALELLVASMAKNPFILKDAVLFGMGTGEDGSLELIDRSTNVHELLGKLPNKQEAEKHNSIMVVVRECGNQNDAHTGEQASFRMAVFASRYASAVIDFVGDDVPIEESYA